jgi:hypothetical protein
MAAWELNPGWHIRAMYSKWALWWSRRARGGGGEFGPCPDFFNYSLAFTLQLRKITVKPQSRWSKCAQLVNSEHVSMSTCPSFIVSHRSVNSPWQIQLCFPVTDWSLGLIVHTPQKWFPNLLHISNLWLVDLVVSFYCHPKKLIPQILCEVTEPLCPERDRAVF